MFFEVSPRRKTPQKKKKEIDEVIEVLSLAPFSHVPKLFFDDVLVGSIVIKKLIVKNPTSLGIEIHITKSAPPERFVTFNWTSCFVPADNETILEISWRPIKDGAWRDVIQLSDKNKIKRDVAIVFKSKSKEMTKKTKKQPSAPLRKKPMPDYYNKAPKLKKNGATTTVDDVNKKKTTSSLRIKNGSSMGCVRGVGESEVIPKDRRETYTVAYKEKFLRPLQFCNFDNISQSTPKFSSSSLVPSITIVEETDEENFEDSLNDEPKSDTQYPPQTPPVQSIRFDIRREMANISHTPLMFTPLRPNDSLCTGSTMKRSPMEEEKNDDFKIIKLGEETYTKLLNVSSQTYVKGNVSSETYTIDNSLPDIPSGLNNPSPKVDKLENRTSLVSQWINKAKTAQKRKSHFTLNLEPAKKRTHESSPKQSTIGGVSNVKRVGSKKKSLNMKSLVNTYKISVTPTVKEENEEEEEVVVKNPEDVHVYLNDLYNPYVLATTHAIPDPFMVSSMYFHPRWLDEQEVRFKKWLNLLLTPPEDLSSNLKHVNVAKVWEQCAMRDAVEKAPTREEASNDRFHKSNNKLLDTLRVNAAKLYRSTDLMNVASRCNAMIENGKISVRRDKNIHLDLGLQQEILALFLCYNPLWLRIGLETIYRRSISLRSNSDHIGLTLFLKQNFFNDAYLLRKHKNKRAPDYAANIKKFQVKTFMLLIYFLDQAKLKKLLPYDPCLFCKDAPIKESKEILIKFTSLTLCAMGDIMKLLKIGKYTLDYKQTFINEFEYGVENIGVDLRDGIRLVRVMEVVLLRNDLTDHVRAPPISKLQKVHNVKVALDSLSEARYDLISNIEAKDIVEGHREKTLSLLWQIICKFQSPRFTKAVLSVQRWWRSEQVQRKVNQMRMVRELKMEAANVIKKWYGKQKLRRKIECSARVIGEIIEERKVNRCACRIQSFWKMYVCRRRYLKVYGSALIIQRFARTWLQNAQFRTRNSAAKVVQNWWRSIKIRRDYVQLKMTVLFVEQIYLAKKSMQRDFDNYSKLKHYAILIQQRYRANRAMKMHRNEFLDVSNAVRTIQRRYRARRLARKCREEYLDKLRSALIIQHRYRCFSLRKNYLRFKRATLTVQRRFRANLSMRNEQIQYRKLRVSVVCVQRRFRAALLMKTDRENYQKLRKASICIQKHFRCYKVRANFVQLRNSTIFIQRKWRANQMMKKQQTEYENLKNSVVKIQTRFRANELMKIHCENYQKLREASICIQKHFRCYKMRANFVQLKNLTILIQRKWRANQLMKKQQTEYENLKISVVKMQMRFRATQLMKINRENYQKLRKVSICIQKHFRCFKMRANFVQLKNLTIFIQRKWRANQLMKKQQTEYENLKTSVVKMQMKFRATQLMKIDREKYQKLREASICIQKHFRCYKVRSNFVQLRNSTILIQRKWRANQMMKKQQKEYENLKTSVVKMQMRFRATQLMKIDHENYQKLRKASICIQKHFKGHKTQSNFLALKQSTIKMQGLFRATLSMKSERSKYENLKSAVIKVQRRFRANKLMRIERENYERKRRAARRIQKAYRDHKRMILERKAAREKLKSVLLLQKYARGLLVRRVYQKLLTPEAIAERKLMAKMTGAAVIIQRHWRGHRVRKSCERRVREIKMRVDAIRRRQQTTRTNNVEQQTLKNRVRNALVVFDDTETLSLSECIVAMADLEYVTSVCPKTCQLMNAKVRILYLLIRSTNRSLEGVQACSATAGVLVNMCKYAKSAPSAWIPDELDHIVTAMIHFCKLEDPLFVKLATIVWVYAHRDGERYRAALRGLPHVGSRVRKIRELCERQQRMVAKGAAAAAYNNNKRTTTTTSLFAEYTRQLPLPSLVPHWGLEFKDRPNLFTNSVHAARSLCQILL